MLTALAVLLRLGPLRPPSLWIDDAWAALIIKTHTVHDALLVGGTAPGFAVLLKGWLAVVGFSELNAQLLPFVIGVTTPALLYVVLRRGGVGSLGASVGALVLVASVVHMTYSTRVKQYTLDGFVALIVLAVAWWLIREVENSRRWWIFAATCLAGILLSSSAIAVAASSTTVALALLVWRNADPRFARAALPPVALISVFAAAWWWLILRPRVNGELKNYWSGYFVPHNQGLGHAVFIAARGLKDVGVGVIPLPTVAAALVVPAAVATLLLCRNFAGAALLVIAPCGLAVLLAFVRAVPLGTGRTDLYLYPGLAMAIGLAVHELRTRSLPLTLLGTAALVAVGVATFKPIVPYPPRDVRPLVQQLELRASPSDSILVRPDDDFGFGLYTTWPVTFLRADVATGFAARIDHRNVHVPLLVPIGLGLSTESWQAAIMRAKESSSRVWLLVGGHSLTPSLPRVRARLKKDGFSLDFELDRPGAVLTRWSDQMPSALSSAEHSMKG